MQKVTLAFMSGIGMAPAPVWLDDKARFFGFVDDLSVMPAGYQKVAPRLRAIQEKVMSQMVLGIARKMLTSAAKAPILFNHSADGPIKAGGGVRRGFR